MMHFINMKEYHMEKACQGRDRDENVINAL
jgi:hypothetical protein